MPYLSRSKTSEREQQKDTEHNSPESVHRPIPSGPAFDILNLQRMAGNQAVIHVLQSGRYSYPTSKNIAPPTATVQIMKQPAGPEPPQRVSAQTSSPGGVQGLTRKQIRRVNFLRGLAARPSFALDSWKRLRPDEQTAVVAYMAELYGTNFARRFQSATLKLPHREDLIVILTNDPDYTPERLTASGYKLFSADPIQHWVHPSGKEVWVLPPSKGEPQQALPPEDPAVIEARDYAEDFTTERDHIVDLGKQLRDHIGKPDYPQLYRQFWDKFNKWQNELNSIREEALPDLKDQVGSQDQQALEQQAKRLDDLFEWKSSGFPDLVRDLPPP